MRPILAGAAILMALLWAPASWALGLGGVELRSALNQPLDARIELVSPREEELERLNVGIASSEHFERYGLERGSVHARMRFEVVRDGSEAYIHVTTREPVRDPFISFLVEARWASGRLLREYTLLLDPPDFGPGEAATPSGPEVELEPEDRPRDPDPERAEQVMPTEPEPEADPLPEPDPVDARDETAPALGGRYGPVERNQTLWNIADELRPSGVSVNQMMIALFEANPGAFQDNINHLRQGAVLRVPERAELDSIQASAANQEVSRQYEEWEEGRTRVAEAPEPERETRDELRLVAPGDEEADTVGVGTEEEEVRIAELEAELDQVREDRDQATDEGEQLRGRVSELEEEIEELRRMVELKDEQLASLQQRVRDDDLAAGLEEEPVFADEEDEALPEEEVLSPEEEEALAEEEEGLPAEEDDEEAAVAAADEPADDPEAAAAEPGADAAAMLSRIMAAMQTPAGMGALGALALAALLGLVAVRRRRATEALAGEDAAGDGVALGEAEATDESMETVVEDVNLSEDLEEHGAGETGDDGQASAMDVDEVLDEADFHIAYGTYDKASGLLEKSLSSRAEDSRLHLKLLETHLAAGNAAAFMEAARRLHGQVSEDSDDWREAARMGREIAPNESLFAVAAPSPDAAEESGDAGELGEEIGDLTPPESDTIGEGSLHRDDVEESFDLDMGMDLGEADEADEGEESGADDFSFELPEVPEEAPESSPEPPEQEASLAEAGESQERPAADATDSEDELAFDLGDLDTEGPGPSLSDEQAEQAPEPAGEDPSSAETAGEDEFSLDLDAGDGLDLDEPAADGGTEDAGTSESSDEGLEFPTVDVPPEKASDAFGTDSQAQFEKAFQELSAYVDTETDGVSGSAGDQWQLEGSGSTSDDDVGGGIGFADDEDDDLLDLGEEDGDEVGEIDTKIDLARAYIDMGDSEGARGILDEVMDEGNDEQKKEARSLIDSI